MSNLRLKWHKLWHWEYWPLRAVYYPLFPVWLFFSVKARSFFFFNAANPSMKNGGMAMESKMDIYKIIPSQHIPKTVFIPKGASLQEILGKKDEVCINFPFIVKPNIGMKSFGVAKIYNEEALCQYLKRASTDLLIQELITYPNEVGVFYVRKPEQGKGSITGIVSKEFLTVSGDGKSSVLQLIKKNPRSHLQLVVLKKRWGVALERVLAKDEKFVLVPYGSHTRGAKFVDRTGDCNARLVKTIDAICSQIPEFYYGRLDILYHSFEELSQGKNFKIIEVNGAGSEATHIYDPKHSLFFAWKEITRHWNLLCDISISNHKKGHPYLSFKDGRAMLKANDALEAQLKLI
ncbi:MAG: D-alanine--D-alanine ligase [Bacteroidota bacterium]